MTANSNWNVKGLILEGVPGTGKTTLLESIMRSQRYVDRSFLSTIVLSEHQTQRVLEAKEKEEGLEQHDNVTLLENHVRYLGGIMRGLKGMPWCENGRTNNRVTYLMERFHLTHVYHYAHVEWKDVKCAPEFEPPIALIDGRRVAVVFSPTWRRYHGQTNPSSPQVV